jgi:hypothetical protein
MGSSGSLATSPQYCWPMPDTQGPLGDGLSNGPWAGVAGFPRHKAISIPRYHPYLILRAPCPLSSIVSSKELAEGREVIVGIGFGLVERTGIEPVTPCLQSRIGHSRTTATGRAGKPKCLRRRAFSARIGSEQTCLDSRSQRKRPQNGNLFPPGGHPWFPV